MTLTFYKRVISTVLTLIIIVLLMTPLASAAFSDVPSNAWYAGDVNDVQQYGILKGVGDNKFNPTGNMTLAEAITLTARTYAYEHGEIVPVQTQSPWYSDYVNYADAKGLCANGEYGTDYNKACNRLTMAKLFARVVTEEKTINNVTELPDVQNNENNKSVFYLYNQGVLTGNDEYGSFKPYSNITRAEAAAILNRVLDSNKRKAFSIKTPQKTATETFKIGGTAPLTGPAAIYGQSVKNGAELAVKELNSMGKQVQFVLRYEDDSHDAGKAINAYKTLKDWGMQISLSSVTSGPAEATSVLNMEDRIFGLTPSASSVATIDGKDNIYQMCYMDPNQGAASAQFIAARSLGNKIAIIWKNDDIYSKSIHDTFIMESFSLGLEIVSDTTFCDGKDSDFSLQLADAQDSGADLVFLPMYYQPASLIFAHAAKMGYTPKWFGVDGLDGILTMRGFDTSLAEGVMLLSQFNADSKDEKTQRFVRSYLDEYGTIPNQFSANAYDCIYAYYQALTSAGATSNMTAATLNDLMIEQFSSMTFSGLTGENITWRPDGVISKQPKGMVIQGGAYVGMN